MQDLKDAEDKASSALESFKEQLAETSAAQSAADNAAAEAGAEVARHPLWATSPFGMHASVGLWW